MDLTNVSATDKFFTAAKAMASSTCDLAVAGAEAASVVPVVAVAAVNTIKKNLDGVKIAIDLGAEVTLKSLIAMELEVADIISMNRGESYEAFMERKEKEKKSKKEKDKKDEEKKSEWDAYLKTLK